MYRSHKIPEAFATITFEKSLFFWGNSQKYCPYFDSLEREREVASCSRLQAVTSSHLSVSTSESFPSPLNLQNCFVSYLKSTLGKLQIRERMSTQQMRKYPKRILWSWISLEFVNLDIPKCRIVWHNWLGSQRAELQVVLPSLSK